MKRLLTIVALLTLFPMYVIGQTEESTQPSQEPTQETEKSDEDDSTESSKTQLSDSLDRLIALLPDDNRQAAKEELKVYTQLTLTVGVAPVIAHYDEQIAGLNARIKVLEDGAHQADADYLRLQKYSDDQFKGGLLSMIGTFFAGFGVGAVASN